MATMANGRVSPGYGKTVKNKRVKQLIKFSSSTHLYFQFRLSTLHRSCKRNADWFSYNRQPINIDFDRSVVDCGPRFVILC